MRVVVAVGTWVRRGFVLAGACVLAGGAFFGVVYLMICEFTKAVE